MRTSHSRPTAQAAATTQQAKAASCQLAKDKKLALTYQIEDVKAEYRAKIEVAQQNPGGLCCGALEDQISKIRKDETAKLAPLEAEQKKASAEVSYYCY